MIKAAVLNLLKFLAQKNFHWLRQAVSVLTCECPVEAKIFLDCQIVSY